MFVLQSLCNFHVRAGHLPSDLYNSQEWAANFALRCCFPSPALCGRCSEVRSHEFEYRRLGKHVSDSLRSLAVQTTMIVSSGKHNQPKLHLHPKSCRKDGTDWERPIILAIINSGRITAYVDRDSSNYGISMETTCPTESTGVIKKKGKEKVLC